MYAPRLYEKSLPILIHPEPDLSHILCISHHLDQFAVKIENICYL